MKAHLKEYLDKEIYPFHMPGHKRNAQFLNFGGEAVEFDVTEFEGMDNLHDAQGFILESQKSCARLFGAEESFYLVNGSTSGIIGAILACCSSEDSILVGRNCHKSVYSGIIYSGARPVFIYPEITEYGFSGVINPDEAKAILKSDPSVKAFLITSPTYEGIVSDIGALSKICHEHGVILIVDEAHGAHFKFSDYFPLTALEMGADIVIQSFHKTLPAFTQSAVLHIQGKRVNRKILKKHLQMIQSSSPSYLLMTGLDNCIRLIQNSQETVFSAYEKYLTEFRSAVKKCRNIFLIDGFKESTVFDWDKGKLVFYLNKEIDGEAVEEILREKYRIQIEMSSKYHLILMTSIADVEEGFCRLKKAVLDIEDMLNSYPDRVKIDLPYPKPLYKTHPKDAMVMDTVKIPLKDAEGNISGQFITPYPPGIPLIAPGEVIAKDVIDYIENIYGTSHIEIIQEIAE